MPVWHDLTKELRESGALQVVGVVQEQHPDRAQLYADWQGLDFPILWDPFNTMGVDYVLISSFVDGHGMVRAKGLSAKDEDGLRALLNKDWSRPEKGLKAPDAWITPAMGRVRIAHPPGSLAAVQASISRVLWPAPGTSPTKGVLDELVTNTEKRLASTDVIPSDHFRAGVARRLRFDSEFSASADGQASIDHWVRALTLNPNQYVWRRRIQQWGPRLDKPYPFYDWVDTAFADLKERGHVHAPLRVALSGSEIAGKGKSVQVDEGQPSEPDPDGKIQRDKGILVSVASSSAPHSDIANSGENKGAKSARIHLTLRPLPGSHWTPDTDAPEVWLQTPEGWSVASQRLAFPGPQEDSTSSPLSMDFEIKAPKDAQAGTLSGYLVYSICKADGVCLFRRQDFSLEVRVAQVSEKPTGKKAE